MRTIHLKTIIPDKLYQRGQFVTFPWNTKLSMLEEYEINMVVNLWSRPDPELHAKPGLIYIHWPINGFETPKLYEPMVELINDHLLSGSKVLVHCEAGVNRSIWLVAKLWARHNRTTGSEAISAIKEIAPHFKLRPGLKKDLELCSDYR